MENKEDFEPLHCQLDYLTDSVTVQFEGKFDYNKAMEYLKTNYPDFKGNEVIEISHPSEFRGMKNTGYVTFQ